jgi:hypothetical protein
LNRLLLPVVATATAVLLLPAQIAQAATANHKPAVPTGLSLSGVPCGSFVGTTTPEFGAQLADPDFGAIAGETVTATFALRRAGQRTELTSPALTSAGVARVTQATPLVDGGRYVLEARATDAAGAVSKWSPPCTFTVDTTRPAAPTVTSADYPATGAAGGPGVTGRFTFASADRDVVKFRYSPGVQEVAVGPHGKATIRYTPQELGTHTITVQAIDRAGNRSAETAYVFVVRNPDPRVLDDNPGGGVGEPRTVTLSSAVPEVVSYTYRLNDEAPATVPAGTDQKATITVTPDRPGVNYLYVTSRTSTGVVSAEIQAALVVVVPTTPPTITSPDFPGDGTAPPLVGQAVTFTFQPGMPGVTEYDWSTDPSWATKQTVTANPDGTATLHLTLAQPYPYFEIFVRSRTAAGVESDAAYGGWELTSHAPIVESADYPRYGSGSGPGAFTFRPAHDGVTGYDYTVAGGESQTVTGETATITWTPTGTGTTTLVVREHIGPIISDPTEYTFTVTE